MPAGLPHMGGDTTRIADESSNGAEVSGLELSGASQEPRSETIDVGRCTQTENEALRRAADLEARYPAGNSTAVGAVANFVNTIVGAGIVGLPFALAQSGLWAGIFMMCLAAYLTSQSTNMLIAAGVQTGRLNYEELMASVFGNAGIYAFSFFAGVLAFGAMSAYLIIVGDTVTTIVAASGVTAGAFAERSSVIIIFGIFCVLPLSLLKDLSKLSYTSSVSILADLLLTIIVCFAGASEARGNPDIDRSETLAFIQPTIFAGFGAISFAFVCQSSSFLVYRSMAKGGVERWACVTRWSASIALIMGLTLGLGGYLNFVQETEGNILNNFSATHEAASVARGLLAVTMVFTYPMEMYVLRHVIDVAIFQTLIGKGPASSARHYAITLVLWALSIILATSTDDLGSILEIFGAFGANAVGYVMPALLYLKANHEDVRRALCAWRKGSDGYVPCLRDRLVVTRTLHTPVFMVVFGVVAMIAGVITAVNSELSSTKA